MHARQGCLSLPCMHAKYPVAPSGTLEGLVGVRLTLLVTIRIVIPALNVRHAAPVVHCEQAYGAVVLVLCACVLSVQFFGNDLCESSKVGILKPLVLTAPEYVIQHVG